MHALAGQRVEIGRKGRDQGLALAGLHLRDVALMQEDAAHQLHVEGPQAERAPRRLAAIGEGLGQDIVKGRAIGDALLELGLFDQPIIAQRLVFGFQRVDPSITGRVALIFRSLGVPKIFRATDVKPSMSYPLRQFRMFFERHLLAPAPARP